MKQMNRQRGLSLIELMIVLVILGILTSIALPSYRSFMISNAIASQGNLLHGSLALARSEAISRGVPVSVCRSTNGASCTSGSSESGNTGWGDGWIIFTDLNNDQMVTAGADTILRVQQRLIPTQGQGSILPTNVTTSTVADAITFNALGQNFVGLVRFHIKPPIAEDNAKYYRYVCMANGGRVRMSKTSCTID